MEARRAGEILGVLHRAYFAANDWYQQTMTFGTVYLDYKGKYCTLGWGGGGGLAKVRDLRSKIQEFTGPKVQNPGIGST